MCSRYGPTPVACTSSACGQKTWRLMADGSHAFNATLRKGKMGGFDIDLPFDANGAWGVKTPHRIAGTVSGVKVRGPLALEDGTYRLKLGPAWRRDCPFAPGDEV